MKTTTTTSPLVFCNWDFRPAILVGDKAFAVLKPGEPWTEVDRDDVGYTSAEFSEQHWRRYFAREGYYRINVDRWRPLVQDNIPQAHPLPRKADFDRAALAIVAAQKARAPEPVSKKIYDLDKSPEAVENRIMLEEMERTRKAKEKTYDLDKSPEAVENRDILSMFAMQRAREAAVHLARLGDPTSLPELPDDEVPPTAPL
jgi:hypothetical protein